MALGQSSIASPNNALVTRRDQRRDGFVKVVGKAMREKLANDAEKALRARSNNGIARQLAKEALDIAKEQGASTIFALVDALTGLAARMVNAGDRLEIDVKAAQLLTLAE